MLSNSVAGGGFGGLQEKKVKTELKLLYAEKALYGLEKTRGLVSIRG
jgi:hypothetical protein